MPKNSEYYFTKKDPDYAPKGARDPLALQVLWQHQGKKIIPYLSTVSSDIHDFQILCLAHYFYDHAPDSQFPKFFLRFEQLMAYVRCDYEFGGRGFNGIDATRKRLATSNRISISNESYDSILSDQRAYGIWGKYSRPFYDIKLHNKDDFREVFAAKLSAIKNKLDIENIVNKVLKKPKCSFAVNEILVCRPLLNITDKEKVFYIDNILKFKDVNSYQNELFEFISSNNIPEKLKLYEFIDAFSKSLSPDKLHLKQILQEIKITERLLSPMNQIFRYLQTESHMTKAAILKDKYIDRCKQDVNYRFAEDSDQSKIKNTFLDSIKKDNWQLVKDLVQKNKEVSDWRGGAPWMSIQNESLEVHHFEGGEKKEDYDPALHHTNDYFISTYLNLYRQLN